jgi:hypothetical protein
MEGFADDECEKRKELAGKAEVSRLGLGKLIAGREAVASSRSFSIPTIATIRH